MRQIPFSISVPLGDPIEVYFMDHTENRIVGECPVEVSEEDWPGVAASVREGDAILLTATDPASGSPVAYPAVVISLNHESSCIQVVI